MPPPDTQDDRVDVTVVFNPSLADVDQLMKALAGVGLFDAVVHRRLGIINGAVARSKLALLRDVEGVKGVRPDRKYGPL